MNLCSNNPRLFGKLGGRNLVFKDHTSIEGAIAKAKQHIELSELGARFKNGRKQIDKDNDTFDPTR